MARSRHLGRISLFAFNQDPELDKPIRKSHSYIDSLIVEGRAMWLDEKSAQLLPTKEYLADQRNFVAAGTFDQAWKIEPSGYMPVWQMQTA